MMKFKQFIRQFFGPIYSRHGQGMAEQLVVIMIVGTGTYLIMLGLGQVRQSQEKIIDTAIVDNTVSSYFYQVRGSIYRQKIDFGSLGNNFVSANNLDSLKSILKMAWDDRGIYPVNQCNRCPGRIGYVVTPYKVGGMGLRGLYLVTIKVTHSQLIPATSNGGFKQYQFIVRTN